LGNTSKGQGTISRSKHRFERVTEVKQLVILPKIGDKWKMEVMEGSAQRKYGPDREIILVLKKGGRILEERGSVNSTSI